MDKKAVLEFIEKCEKDGDAPYGFFVVAISREDIAMHCNNETVKKFDKMSETKKAKVLSDIADDMQNVYEEWDFNEDFPKDLDI